MDLTERDRNAAETIGKLSREASIDLSGARIRRTSSRFCLGVEHGDYNGTDLLGVGTDRFIWMAFKPSPNDRVRLYSGNFPEDSVVDFRLGDTPGPGALAGSWGRFVCGVAYILRREGLKIDHGIEGVIYGDIPGGGMSRSASLTLNLILSMLEVNDIETMEKFDIARMAQAVENDYIGSPCGLLDQIMIIFARAGLATLYRPANNTIDHIPLGACAEDFSLVVLDTGTDRPGLEKSTYRFRRAECEKLAAMLQKAGYGVNCLADVKDRKLYDKIIALFSGDHGDLCDRLSYIFAAQNRFSQMLEAWKAGDIEAVGRLFRADGLGLRDLYRISGAELEAMCDIARTVDGVLGERMLGGGDKGASGAIVRTSDVEELKRAIALAYPRSYPHLARKYAVHTCGIVDGIAVLDGMF